MFEGIINFFKRFSKEEKKDSKDTAKERLHLVLMQDRANVSADFLEMMKQEIIEVIKKYIDVDENSIDVKLTNKVNSDGTTGAPALYANIPIVSLKDDTKKSKTKNEEETKNVDEQNENTEEIENEKEDEKTMEEHLQIDNYEDTTEEIKAKSIQSVNENQAKTENPEKVEDE